MPRRTQWEWRVGAAGDADHTAPPPGLPKPQAHPVGNEDPRILGHYVGAPTLTSPHRDCSGIWRAQRWGLTVMERGEGLVTSAQGSRDGIHTCITQVGTSTCSSAHLQNQVRAQSDEGARWGAYLPASDPQGGVLLALSLLCPSPRQVLRPSPPT